MITSLVCGVAVVMVGYFAFEQGPAQIAVLAAGALLVLVGLVAATRYR